MDCVAVEFLVMVQNEYMESQEYVLEYDAKNGSLRKQKSVEGERVYDCVDALSYRAREPGSRTSQHALHVLGGVEELVAAGKRRRAC